jgi:membrane carboxypeptidase/penicillin-binding protein
MRFMKRLLVLLGKSVLALLSVAGVLLLVFEGGLIWHFEYGIGLPSESRLAALPSTGHLCPVSPDSPYVALAEIPPLLRKAVIVFEDPDFYERPDIGPLAQLGLDIINGRRPHWSNITFSTSLNCLEFLAPDCCRGPNLEWQIGRAVFMGRVGRALTRDRILEAYLNEIYLGRGTQGFATATSAYFGKTLEALDVDEIAFLIARLRQPYPNRRDRDLRNFVIDKIHTSGLIDEQQTATAKAAPLPWLGNQPRDL